MSPGFNKLLAELTSRAWAGRNSDIAQQAPSWRFPYVSVLLLIGFTPSHPRTINHSLLSLLPRIVPGLWPFYEDASLNEVNVRAISVENGMVSDTIPDWLDDMLGGVLDIQRFDFQVWRLSALDPDPYSPGDSTLPRSNNCRSPKPTLKSAFILFFSITLTYGLIIAVGVIRDWTGLLSLGLLSAFTSIGSFARLARTTLLSPTHRAVDEVRRARIVLHTERDALIVIHTTESLARLILRGLARKPVLRTGIRGCLHFFSLFLYTFGLVLLANATPETQVAFAAIYAIIASLTLLPPIYPTPIRLEIQREYIPGCENAATYKEELRGQEAFPSYTRTTWYAIYVTQATAWLKRSKEKAGFTSERYGREWASSEWYGWEWSSWERAWYIWLDEALKNVRNINWPAVHELDRIGRGGDAGASAIVYGTRRSSEDEDKDETVDQGREGNDQITPVPVESW